MSHLKFSNFAKKRKVAATIHTYIFITLCLCECVCVWCCQLVATWEVYVPVSPAWSPGGMRSGQFTTVRNSVCVCVCVWQCAKVAKFKDKSLRKAQQKGSNKQRRNWNSQKATCTHSHYRHTHTNSLTHTDTLTLLFEFCNKCWTWQMKYLTPHKLRAPLSVFLCVRIIIVEF